MQLLTLGDSVLIDEYTGVPGGGAAAQFSEMLRPTRFHMLAFDGCRIAEVETHHSADAVIISAGGNDLIEDYQQFMDNPPHAVDALAWRHRRKLQRVRQHNPRGLILVANIYEPSAGLNAMELHILDEVIPAASRRVHIMESDMIPS